jgi:FkbM family methyltransferase
MQGLFWQGTVEDNAIGHIFAEVFKDKLYQLYFLGKKDLTVFDLGANIGITSLYFQPFCKDIYAVEPASDHLECLTKMVEFNKFTNIHPLKYAISNENKKISLNKFANKTAYNINIIGDPRMISSEEVECITIDKLFEITGVKHCDFMKMDIEGEEFGVLGGPGFKNVAPLIDVIIIEMHNWVGRNFNQVKECLMVNGFKTRMLSADATIICGEK